MYLIIAIINTNGYHDRIISRIQSKSFKILANFGFCNECLIHLSEQLWMYLNLKVAAQ